MVTHHSSSGMYVVCVRMRACCRYTRRRPDRTHGGVLNLHTGGFPRAKLHHTTPHTTLTTLTTLHAPLTTRTNTPHHTPTPTHTHHTHTPHAHTTAPHAHTTKTTHTTCTHTIHHTPTPHHTHTTQHSTAPLTTDHDPVISLKCGISVLSVISCALNVFGINKIRNIRNLMRIYCFGINLIFVTVFIS